MFAPLGFELVFFGKLKGTIRTAPPEEDLAGKVYMARAGLFNDLDICLDWITKKKKANMQSSQAIADYTITFKGKSHAQLILERS
jgi:aminobenzoyl-glutamate utilization protein B